jgi:hypothetical protein
MPKEKQELNAEVIGVFPNKVKIYVKDIENFSLAEEKLSVGSYLRISDHEDCAIIAVIDNYAIEYNEKEERKYVIEANPIGFLDNEKIFHRGATNISIPPTNVQPAKKEEIQKIFEQIDANKIFTFSMLSQDVTIKVPVNGDSFFNKHFAIVGSTGSGKSHTIASILQKAISSKESKYDGLNNSHIVLFDLHGEYETAFPEANKINVEKLKLPYWAMNEEELEELLIERGGDSQAYNQTSLLRRIITRNKVIKNSDDGLKFGTPVPFSMQEVLNCLSNLANETVNYENPSELCISKERKEIENENERIDLYFKEKLGFDAKNSLKSKGEGVKSGTYNDGTLSKFINRLTTKKDDKKLTFLFDEEFVKLKLSDIVRNILAYKKEEEANVTVIDLSGVPFEVLSITVSLITRLIFEYGYIYKRSILKQEKETPILLVYEEAHKYVPKTGESRYNSCRTSIERVAKEGRKYGVTLAILSQRPSEISETIFSQCNNFISMRLTNPEDQNYVKRLLPDNLGPLTESLPALKQGEALLLGEAVIMPSLVKIEPCDPPPSSRDIPFYQEWKKQWSDVDFDEIVKKWKER